MKNNICIILVGRGKLAQALKSVFENINQEYILWEDLISVSDRKIGKRYFVVYCSNTDNVKRLTDIFLFTNKYQIPFINGCTDFIFKYDSDNFKTSIVSNDEVIYSIETNTIFINAHNFNIMIVGIMSALKKYGIMISMNHQADVDVIESHQSTKKSVPGTAVLFAENLGISKGEIISVRDESEQLERGVPENRLNGHAYHWLLINNGNTYINIETKVNGRDDYAYGALQICEKTTDLEIGVYDVTDLFGVTCVNI